MTIREEGYAEGYRDGYSKRDGELVRCKDCEYYKTESGECPANNGDDPYYSWIPKPDWYCAEGKRKEGA